jgi:hypothetical protein
VYVFGGDIDWLHLDTSLLLALPAPAKNIVFLKEMEVPAAADVVLFSCRCAASARCSLRLFTFRAFQVQRPLHSRPLQAAASGRTSTLFLPDHLRA